MFKIVKYMNDKWKNKMTVWKCKVFDNISINSVSNDNMIIRCSISSFLQISILRVCFTIFDCKLYCGNNVILPV